MGVHRILLSTQSLTSPSLRGYTDPFVTDLAQTRAHTTIRTYLLRFRHLHILYSYTKPLTNTPRLDLVLIGIQLIKLRQSQPRLPVTLTVLLKIKSDKVALADFDRTMLWAACLLAFFAFLSCSEFTTCSLQAYQPSKHLSIGDEAVNSHRKPTIMSR